MAELYVEGVDELVTGEAVTLDLPPASLGLHVASAAIDVLASVVVLIAGFWMTALLAADDATAAVGSILTLVCAMILLPTTFETLSRGRSLGKLATGLRTVRDDAGPITFQHALRSGKVQVTGERKLAQAFPKWLLLSHFAAVPRPEQEAVPA